MGLVLIYFAVFRDIYIPIFFLDESFSRDV